MQKVYKFSKNYSSELVYVDSIEYILKKINSKVSSSTVFFVDTDVWRKQKKMKNLLKGKNQHVILLKSNERIKNLKFIDSLCKKLVQLNVDKKTQFVAVGGGVIGDLVGFLASIYFRGVRFVQVPTTLLSCVDSALGGKNGVNHLNKKNILGTITQPEQVFICREILKTLPEREVISGLGEIYKYSLISKKIKYKDLINLNCAGLGESKAILALLKNCAEIKMNLVLKDEKDTLGVRQKLNLGHTFAHALESYTGFKKYRHGEAVLWGILFAACISFGRGYLSLKELAQIFAEVQMLQPPLLPPKLEVKKLYKLALSDKKAEVGTLKMVLLKGRRGSGRLETRVPVSQKEFTSALHLLITQP